MNKKQAIIPAGIVTACASFMLLAGCAGQTSTERDFGRSVRLVTTNQVYNKDTLVYTPDDAVSGGHPDRLENVVKSHAGEVADSGQVGRPLSINVTGGPGQ